VGDDALSDRALVASAVLAAIGERRLPPEPVLAAVERLEEELETPRLNAQAPRFELSFN
jgi:hypothetical protein